LTVQRRILAASLAVTLLVVTLMTAIMAWSDWTGIAGDNQRRLVSQADLAAERLHRWVHSGGELDERSIAAVVPPDSRIELTTATGREVVAGEASVGGPTASAAVIDVGLLVVEDTSGSLGRNRWLAVSSIIGIGVAIAVIAVALSIRTSRRLTRPIVELADHADRLASGDLRTSDVRYGIPELDRLATSMDASVERVAGLLAQERRMTVDASHHLKTPLTALSLRLEELAVWPENEDVRVEAQQALDQVERLSRVVDDLLLDRRSDDSLRSGALLESVVAQQLAEWRPAFEAAHRQLLTHVDLPAAVVVDAGPVGQVMATLIENSLVHGAGQTMVEVRRAHGTTWVDVYDQGPGVPDAVAPVVFDRDVSGSGRTGVGLAAAQDAAVSVGGRLTLVQRRPAHFRFFLGDREHPSAVGPEPEEGAETDADDIR
jgi:signal transduction histidine kinase